MILVPEFSVLESVRHLAVGMGAPIDSHFGARRLGPYVALCGSRERLMVVSEMDQEYVDHKLCPACDGELEKLQVVAASVHNSYYAAHYDNYPQRRSVKDVRLPEPAEGGGPDGPA